MTLGFLSAATAGAAATSARTAASNNLATMCRLLTGQVVRAATAGGPYGSTLIVVFGSASDFTPRSTFSPTLTVYVPARNTFGRNVVPLIRSVYTTSPF